MSAGSPFNLGADCETVSTMKRVFLRYTTLAGLLGSIAWLVSEPHWHPLVVSIGLLAGLVASDERLFSSTPKVEGRWQYEVTTSDKEFSHKGDCHIHQEGLKVRVQGVRRYTCSMEGRRRISKPVDIPWSSDWAQICDDGVFRFEYHIAITEPRRGGKYIEAICTLKLISKNPREMSGNYYMLPPFDEATLNCKWGSVVFYKVKENAERLPLDSCEPEDEESTEHIA
jgi:hypothetical protein